MNDEILQFLKDNMRIEIRHEAPQFSNGFIKTTVKLCIGDTVISEDFDSFEIGDIM